MADARLDSEWEQAAAVMAMVHNVQCINRSDKITNPSLLNPMRQKKRERMPLSQVRRMTEGTNGRVS